MRSWRKLTSRSGNNNSNMSGDSSNPPGIIYPHGMDLVVPKGFMTCVENDISYNTHINQSTSKPPPLHVSSLPPPINLVLTGVVII